jgi:hypothetical protein
MPRIHQEEQERRKRAYEACLEYTNKEQERRLLEHKHEACLEYTKRNRSVGRD